MGVLHSPRTGAVCPDILSAEAESSGVDGVARSQWLLGLGAAAVLLVALAMYLTLSGQKAGLGPASEQSRVAKPQATASSPPAPQSLEQSANPPFATNESPHPAQVAGSVPPAPAPQPVVDRPFQQARRLTS